MKTEQQTFETLYRTHNESIDSPRHKVRIHFDGGTPCNVPSRGYGIGYGSYRINKGDPIRVNHARPMSANAAEIFTLIEAIKFVISQFGKNVDLLIVGDSMIALKWAKGVTPKGKPCKVLKGGSDEFRSAVGEIREITKGLNIETQWLARKHAVAAFGH